MISKITRRNKNVITNLQQERPQKIFELLPKGAYVIRILGAKEEPKKTARPARIWSLLSTSLKANMPISTTSSLKAIPMRIRNGPMTARIISMFREMIRRHTSGRIGTAFSLIWKIATTALSSPEM